MSGYVSGGGDVVLYDASGNPITSGTIANDSIANTQRGLDTRGFNYILANDGTWSRWASANRTDGLTGDNSGLIGSTAYNDLTWDKWRNNTLKLLLGAAARTTTTQTATQVNYNGRGIRISLDITANPGGVEILTIEVYPLNYAGNTLPRIANQAMAAATNARYSLYIYPGADGTIDDATKNKTVALIAPRLYFVQVAHSGAGSWTYSLDASEFI